MLATGIAHIEQYSVDGYSTVPTIGTLFLLNFIAAIVIAVGLIAPLRRFTGRYTDRAALAVGGIGLGVLSLAALFVSEQPPVRLRRTRRPNGDRGRDRGRGCRHRMPRRLRAGQRHRPSEEPDGITMSRVRNLAYPFVVAPLAALAAGCGSAATARERISSMPLVSVDQTHLQRRFVSIGKPVSVGMRATNPFGRLAACSLGTGRPPATDSSTSVVLGSASPARSER